MQAGCREKIGRLQAMLRIHSVDGLRSPIAFGTMKAQSTTIPDSSFSRVPSACSACICPYLRENFPFALSPTTYSLNRIPTHTEGPGV